MELSCEKQYLLNRLKQSVNASMRILYAIIVYLVSTAEDT